MGSSIFAKALSRYSEICRPNDHGRSGSRCKYAQRRVVGSELVGPDGGWGYAVLLQEFSHLLERRLAISPWLNQDIRNLAFAVRGTPDVQLSALMETNTSSRCHRTSSSQLAGNDGAELKAPTADCFVGHVDTSFGEQILDVAVAQSEAESQMACCMTMLWYESYP
jgi:hypothetical protein